MDGMPYLAFRPGYKRRWRPEAKMKGCRICGTLQFASVYILIRRALTRFGCDNNRATLSDISVSSAKRLSVSRGYVHVEG